MPSTLRQNVEHPRGDAQLPLWPAGGKLHRQFVEHRKAHPRVWNELLDLALEARSEGRKHWSINAVFEVARYNTRHDERDKYGWKLNNDLRAYYARALMAEHPALAGFFETRSLRSE